MRNNGHETHVGRGNTPWFLSVWTCFSLRNQFPFLALAPLNSPVSLLAAEWSCKYLSSTCSCLHMLATINFIIVLCGIACLVFVSQSFFPGQRILFYMLIIQKFNSMYVGLEIKRRSKGDSSNYGKKFLSQGMFFKLFFNVKKNIGYKYKCFHLPLNNLSENEICKGIYLN